VEALNDQLERLQFYRERAKALYSYYGSKDWYKDKEGEISAGMKAGKLSEDAICNSITELRDTAITMLELRNRDSEGLDMSIVKDYSSYPPKEAEVLRQLDRTVEGIILEATIMTEMEKLWRRKEPLSPEEAEKAYKDMEAKIDEVQQD